MVVPSICSSPLSNHSSSELICCHSLSQTSLDEENCGSLSRKKITARKIEVGSLDQEVQIIALELLNGVKINAPYSSLIRAKFFERALKQPFDESKTGSFNFHELNEKFPHLEKAIRILFLEDRDFDSITDTVFRDIIKTADFFLANSLLNNFMNQFEIYLLEKGAEKNISLELFSEFSNTGVSNIDDPKHPFYEVRQCYDSRPEFALLIADFIYIKAHNESPKNLKNKFYIYRCLIDLYLKIGLHKKALEVVRCFKFLPIEDIISNVNYHLTKIIKIFCENSSFFREEEIFGCIDILSSDDKKAKSLSHFISFFKEKTANAPQEVEKRLNALKISEQKIKAYRMLGNFYVKLENCEKALEAAYHFKSFLDESEIQDKESECTNNQLTDLIEAFCKKSDLFMEEDIFRCIDILSSNAQKAKSLSHFISFFKEKTENSLQEVEKRLNALEISEQKIKAFKTLGSFYAGLEKREKALEIAYYFKSFLDEGEIQDKKIKAVPPLTWYANYQLTELINTFCMNNTLFTADDIHRCIDILSSDDDKAESHRALRDFKEKTEAPYEKLKNV